MGQRFIHVMTFVLLLGACKDVELGRCVSDQDCAPPGVCQASVCVRSDAPHLVLAVDREAARIGETLLVDAAAAVSRTGGMLTWEFSVEPEGAASIEASADSPGHAWYQVARPHLDFDVVVTVRDSYENQTVGRRTIQSVDSPPTVEMKSEPNPFQPGDVLSLSLHAEDPDGDELSFVWSLEGLLGTLEDHGGGEASLHTVPRREDILYRVSVLTSANGLEVRTDLDFSSHNRAPGIIPAADPSAHHSCSQADGCMSRVALVGEIDDVGEVIVAASLLGGPPGIDVALERNGRGYDAILSCRPVCRIAGSHRIEITATDDQGAVAKREIVAEVLNRPPVLLAHDGSVLQHSWHSTDRYRAGRTPGTVVTFFDPDGDPPDPKRIEWTSSSSLVSFSDAGVIDPEVAVVGSKEQIEALSLSLLAADINGAEASNSQPLPVGNRLPVIFFDGDETEGHLYVGKTPEGVPIFRKAIVAPVEDPDGDPLEIWVRPPVPTPPGMSIVEEGGTHYLEVQGTSSLGQSYLVSVNARDTWGEATTKAGLVRISNRPPSLTPPTGTVKSGTGCERKTCCADLRNGSCLRIASGPVLTVFDQPGPALFVQSIRLEDPDGDPVTVTLIPGAATRSYAFFSDTTTPEVEFTEPRQLSCTRDETNGRLSCPYQIRLYGKSDTNGTCRLDGGTGAPASFAMTVAADDGTGQIEYRTFTLSTVGAGGNCL